METFDIRLCPSIIENDKRIYIYKGYKCYLSKTFRYAGHANVYLYTLITPENKTYTNIDLAEVNNIINN